MSVHNETIDRCVDVFAHADGLFSYKEFRRDSEDRGAWYPAGAVSAPVFATAEEAIGAASDAVIWLKSIR